MKHSPGHPDVPKLSVFTVFTLFSMVSSFVYSFFTVFHSFLNGFAYFLEIDDFDCYVLNSFPSGIYQTAYTAIPDSNACLS